MAARDGSREARRRRERTAPAPSTTAADSPVDRSLWWTAVGLALLCCAVYSNSLHAGFALDNRQLILRDPRVHEVSAENLRLILHHSYWWPYGESGLYRPLSTLSYLFNYAVLGNADRPLGYHAVNLVLHVVNVLLLWRVTARITSGRWTAAVTAAVWAVLPLSTEAVTNIVGRADLMAATTSLGGVLLYLRWRARASRPGAAAGVLVAATIAVVVTLGTLAKESAVAVLGVLAVIEIIWWQGSAGLRRLAVLGAACALPLGWWLWQRGLVLGAAVAPEFPFTDNPIAGAPFWLGRLTAVQVMWRYIALLAWPAHLSNDYSYPQIPLAAGTAADWASVTLLGIGVLAALWQARAQRAVLFFAAFAFITFLPVSNLLFATGTIMGERLVYLPSAGLAALVAAGLAHARTDTVRAHGATAVVVLLVIAGGVRAYARNPDWTNDVTLWRSAVASAPRSAKAHRALAEALYDADPSHANLDEVMRHADQAVALLEPLDDRQNTFQAFRQAGAYYLDKVSQVQAAGTPATSPDVKRLYSRALHLLDRAVVIARHAAERTPGYSVEPEADAQRLRAVAILGLENPSLSLNAAKRARDLSPLHPMGYRLSAQSLLAMHREEEAVMTLLTGSIVSGDRGLGQDAMTLYADGADPQGCAVVGTGAGAALDPQCPTVVRHSCIASAAAYQILKKAGHADRAEQTKQTALATFACPESLMDRTSSLVP
ncbi:MAG: DUF1736 domain-containing protein [Vicinamibacterales bacterium]